MLVIRLFRAGKKNQPFFKIVVTDKRKSSTGGRFVEKVGFFNPLTKEKSLKAERIKYWISVGAKPLETVYNLLVSEKILEGKKIPIHIKKKKEKKAAKAEEKPKVIKETKAIEEKPVEGKKEEIKQEEKKEEIKKEEPKQEKRNQEVEQKPEVQPQPNP